MQRSDYFFRFGMIVAISLLATVAGFVVERLFGVNYSTLIVGPLLASLAAFIWLMTWRT
jgi:hypothetical protein